MTAGRGIARRIGGQTIRFAPRWSRYYTADYEPETFRFLRERVRAGAVAMDIGAHVGLFTVVMAHLAGSCGRVIAFEPTPRTRRVLERTVRLNGCTGTVEVRPEAVAEQTGKATFYDAAEPGSNASSLVAHARGEIPIIVSTITLDDFVAERALLPHCIKIDAEGAELGVLRGGSLMLARARPALAISLHPAPIRRGGGSLDEIWALLSDFGYDVSMAGRAVDGAWFREQTQIFDVHALPRVQRG